MLPDEFDAMLDNDLLTIDSHLGGYTSMAFADVERVGPGRSSIVCFFSPAVHCRFCYFGCQMTLLLCQMISDKVGKLAILLERIEERIIIVSR